jgi:hypothetical protein
MSIRKAVDVLRVRLRHDYVNATLVVEPCVDADEWSWSIRIDGGEWASGYEATMDEALAKGKQAWAERLDDEE